MDWIYLVVVVVGLVVINALTYMRGYHQGWTRGQQELINELTRMKQYVHAANYGLKEKEHRP